MRLEHSALILVLLKETINHTSYVHSLDLRCYWSSILGILSRIRGRKQYLQYVCYFKSVSNASEN